MNLGNIVRVVLCLLHVARGRQILRHYPPEGQDPLQQPDTATNSAPPTLSDHQKEHFIRERFSESLDPATRDDITETRPAQPPQHYIPGLSIDPSVRSLVLATYERLRVLITYKPPVGLIVVAIFYRLVGKGRLWKAYDIKERNQPERRQARTRDGSQRSRVLDSTDQLYLTQGGIQPIRRKLLLSVAANLLECHPLAQRSAADAHTTRPTIVLLSAMVSALKITNHPGSPRIRYVQDLVEPYSCLQSTFTDPSILPGRIGQREQPISPNEKQMLVDLCRTTVDACFTDALLRVCRDRLLASSLRLARTQGYWYRRVKGLQGLPKLFPLDKLVDGDRMRLSLTTAAFEQELMRLGQIVSVLTQAPVDMEQDSLIEALRMSEAERQAEKLDGKSQRNSRKGLHIPNIGSLTNKASQYYRDGAFSIRKMGNGDIRGSAAISCLLDKPTEQDAWMKQTREWTARARDVLRTVVHDTLASSTPGNGYGMTDFAESMNALDAVQSKPLETNFNSGATLSKLVKYVDNISTWRRVGEGKELRLGDTFIADWSRRLDICGIPSSLVALWTAMAIHVRIRPYWPRARRDAIDIALKVKEIVDTRLVTPLRDIAADILNKNPGMMAGFGLDDESSSLDRMLRDMGFGDGTESSRREALTLARDEYEKDIQGGLVGILMKGRLVTLLLLQMQQLKVGLLSALADIDVLMQGNRINFQVMAAIPAIVLVYLGGHFFIRRMYNIRAKDLRPVTAVHADMTNYLCEMERVILSIAEPTMESGRAERGALTPTPTLISLLSYSQLGGWMLLMHRYLLLLDYSSPPYPQTSCNDIHATLQAFGGRSGSLLKSGSTRNLEILHRVQTKHEGLIKFL